MAKQRPVGLLSDMNPRNLPNEELERVSSLPDAVGLVRIGQAWQLVKKLGNLQRRLPYSDNPVELHGKQKELIRILRDEYPDTAKDLGLTAKARKAESPTAQNRGERKKKSKSERQTAPPKPFLVVKTIRKLLKELAILQPQMHNESSYTKLQRKYSQYLAFKIANEHVSTGGWTQSGSVDACGMVSPGQGPGARQRPGL
jgi:hypothetical protein